MSCWCAQQFNGNFRIRSYTSPPKLRLPKPGWIFNTVFKIHRHLGLEWSFARLKCGFHLLGRVKQRCKYPIERRPSLSCCHSAHCVLLCSLRRCLGERPADAFKGFFLSSYFSVVMLWTRLDAHSRSALGGKWCCIHTIWVCSLLLQATTLLCGRSFQSLLCLILRSWVMGVYI